MYKVIGPNGKERQVQYVKALADHVEVFVIGKRNKWVDFWPIDDFKEANPDFTEYTKFENIKS